MQVLESDLDPHSESFQRNAEYQRSLAQELRGRLALVRQGGGARAQARHAEQGKLFVRTRIDRLLDEGSPFLELSPLAAWEMYGEEGGRKLPKLQLRPTPASSPASAVSRVASA